MKILPTKKIREQKVFSVLSVVVLSVAVVALSTFSQGGSAHKNVAAAATRAAITWSNNPVPNPGYTIGPNCSMNVVVLLDRSGSMGESSDPSSSASQAKNAIKDMYQLLHDRAVAQGKGDVFVYFIAFGTYAILQNGPTPPGVEPAVDSWDWLGSINIKDQASLDMQKRIVDETYISNTNNTFDPAPDKAHLKYRGYLGDHTPSATVNLRGTNYDDAFAGASSYINFYAGDPSLRGDRDFDLVLLLTDGDPNMHNGPDHIASDDIANEPGISSTVHTDENFGNARSMVNWLRKGEEPTGLASYWFNAVPPVNVVGVLAGNAVTNTPIQSTRNMNHVFGTGNWYSTADFNEGLKSSLTAAVDGLGCSRPTRDVQTGINLAVTKDTNVISEDGGSAYAHLSVENTSDVRLNNVNLTYADGTPISGGSGLSLAPHTTYAIPTPLVFRAEVGVETINTVIKVTSSAVLESTDRLVSGSLNPSDEKTVSFVIQRTPLPS